MSASPVVPKIEPTAIGKLDLAEIKCAARLAGWISPEGAYFRAGAIFGHEETARQITGCEDGWFMLENSGWIHLTGMGNPETASGRIRPAQVNTLVDLASLFPESVFSTYINLAIQHRQE